MRKLRPRKGRCCHIIRLMTELGHRILVPFQAVKNKEKLPLRYCCSPTTEKKLSFAWFIDVFLPLQEGLPSQASLIKMWVYFISGSSPVLSYHRKGSVHGWIYDLLKYIGVPVLTFEIKTPTRETVRMSWASTFPYQLSLGQRMDVNWY